MGFSLFCDLDTWRGAACWCGNLGTMLSVLQNIPQILLNRRRQSTIGFSHATVYIRFVGLSFLLSSSIFLGMQGTLIIFVMANLLVNYVFLYQFATYDGQKWTYAFWGFPVAAFLLGLFAPKTLLYTQWLNTATQILGFFPYMYEIVSCETTAGVSLLYHHMNFVASLCGLVSCGLSVSCRIVEWCVHGGPLLWSISVFMLALYYDEMRFFDGGSEKQRAAPSETAPFVGSRNLFE